ncbi:MAG: hypothetical protein HFJ98_08800 [Eubacterium sp.]|nr:hypothetical protein [Eubacterium sp.]
MKKIISLFLSAIMIFSIMAGIDLTAFAGTFLQSSGSCGTNAKYTFDGRTLTISGSGAISGSAFLDANEEYYRVEIKNGITSVGSYAFCGSGVTDAIIAESVDYIAEHSFGHNAAGRSIVILNPKCSIADNGIDEYMSGTIYGYNHSTAQKYVQSNGLSFESIDGYNCSKGKHIEIYYYGLYYCAVCQKQIFKDCEEGIHDWDSGTVTKKATCTANGIKTYTCTKCKATKTETIKATGHSYDNGKITKKPTSTSTGIKTYTCTKCKATKTETVAKIKLLAPAAKITVNANGSFKIYWNKISGADKYDVYIDNGTGYKLLRTVTGTSTTTETAHYGKKYAYKVRAINSKDSSVTSAFSAVVTATNTKKLVTPKAAQAKVNANGTFTLSWDKVTGATRYGIYMLENGKYKWIKSTSAVSWTTGTAQYGKKYTYKVFAVNDNNKTTDSNFSSAFSATNNKKLQTPSLKVAVNKNGSFKLSWGKVTGAEKYELYIKQANGSYKLMKTTTSTSFTTVVASKGKTYSYKIKAVTSKNKNTASNYSNTVSAKRK